MISACAFSIVEFARVRACIRARIITMLKYAAGYENEQCN